MKRIRVIWAIAAKDIVAAVKTKTTAMVLIGTFFIVGLYRTMPIWMSGSEKPYLPFYDAGNSELAALLDNSQEITSRSRASQEGMQEYLSRGTVPELGLVIPADFDQSVANGSPLVLQGYVMSWVSDTQANRLRQSTEALVAELVGAPVEIQLLGNTVYMQPDSRGWTLAPMGIIFVVLLMGSSLVPQLVLEEKTSKTMDALLLSPAGPFDIAIGKAVVGLFYSALSASIALALNAHLIRQWWLAITATLCGALFAIALGLFLGAITNTQQHLRLLSGFVIVPLFVPPFLVTLGELLPDGVITICQWVPTSALLRLLRISFSNQSGLSLYGPPFALLLGSTAVVMALVVWQLRRSDR